ncbi:ornithine decarboxylase-like, partial [Rhipicephalus sanguineus]|uniref:ornithine decarboxylase-like n=1 Tax=Rhipicephalus sanguineus TaxID=34632 RepID=UPI00189313E9
SPMREDRTSCMEHHRLLHKMRLRNGHNSGAWWPTRQDEAQEGGRWTSASELAPRHPNREKETSIFSHGTAEEVAREIYQKQDEDDAFFVCDLRDITRKVELWHQCLPRVTPFFAIKACGDPVVLAELNAQNVNFDCSNNTEIQTILEMGVDPDRIIYAHPVKSTSHMKFAAAHGVTLMTFDCVEELQKIVDKNARLLLRIKGDSDGCKISFDQKFGCSVDEARHILETARDLHCNVVGV